MPKAELHNVGALGFIGDVPGHQLPPEAWTAVRNIRFVNKNAEKVKGHAQVLGTPGVSPSFLLNIPSVGESIWLYTSLTKMYVISSGVHTDITRAAGDYTAGTGETWHGGVLGGIPILNNGNDAPQMWPSLSPGTPAEDLFAWPEGVRAKIVKPYGPFLVALNIVDSLAFPHMIWWSHASTPGDVPTSWDYTDPTKLAGRSELTDIEGGQIVDGLMLRELFIIYKENSTHVMRFMGGQQVMKTDLLFATSGILAARCVCTVMKGSRHFLATGDDIITHNGQSFESVLDGRAARYLINDMNGAAKTVAFAAHNPAMREAWFCYPESGAEQPTKALIWNYKDNTIGFRDFNGSFALPGFIAAVPAGLWSESTDTWEEVTDLWGAEGQKQLVYCRPEDDAFYQLDVGDTFDGAPIPFALERVGLGLIGKDRQGQPKVSLKVQRLVKRLWPKIRSELLTNIRLGVQQRIGGEVSWTDPFEYDPTSEDFVDPIVTGAIIAVRFEGSGTIAWSLEGYDLDLELLGEY